MLHSRGSVQLLVRQTKAELGQHLARCGVIRVVTGEESLRAGGLKCELNQSAPGFLGQTAPPTRRNKMKSQFVHLLFQAIGP